jgi:protein involved in polysaccharide export with SLBB domain
MGGHEISDGTYAATVATCNDDLVTFIAPACEPAVLIAPDNTLPQAEQTELSPGDPVKITIVEETVTSLADDPE